MLTSVKSQKYAYFIPRDEFPSRWWNQPDEHNLNWPVGQSYLLQKWKVNLDPGELVTGIHRILALRASQGQLKPLKTIPVMSLDSRPKSQRTIAFRTDKPSSLAPSGSTLEYSATSTNIPIASSTNQRTAEESMGDELQKILQKGTLDTTMPTAKSSRKRTADEFLRDLVEPDAQDKSLKREHAQEGQVEAQDDRAEDVKERDAEGLNIGGEDIQGEKIKGKGAQKKNAKAEGPKGKKAKGKAVNEEDGKAGRLSSANWEQWLSERLIQHCRQT